MVVGCGGTLGDCSLNRTLGLIPLDPRKGDPAPLREREEDDADSLAIAWGFEAELQAFLAEVERAPL